MNWYSWEGIDFSHSCDLKDEHLSPRARFHGFGGGAACPTSKAMERRPGDEVVFCRARLPSQNKVNLFEFSIYSHFFYILKPFIDS